MPTEFIENIVESVSLAIANKYNLDPFECLNIGLQTIKETYGINSRIVKIVDTTNNVKYVGKCSDNSSDIELYAYNDKLQIKGKCLGKYSTESDTISLVT